LKKKAIGFRGFGTMVKRKTPAAMVPRPAMTIPARTETRV